MMKIEMGEQKTTDTTPKDNMKPAVGCHEYSEKYSESPCDLGSSLSKGPNKPPLPPN